MLIEENENIQKLVQEQNKRLQDFQAPLKSMILAPPRFSEDANNAAVEPTKRKRTKRTEISNVNTERIGEPKSPWTGTM
jgi:hypothetical protein